MKLKKKQSLRPNAWMWSNHLQPNPLSGFTLPLVLLVIGVYFLGKDLGWFAGNVSFWPVLLVVIAGYWILKRLVYAAVNR